VASLVPTHHPELLQIPLDQYQVLSSKPLGELPVLRLQREIWGKQRTVLLFISEQLRQGQIRGLMQHVKKATRALERWKTQTGQTAVWAAHTRGRAKRQIQNDALGTTPEQGVEADYDPTRKGADRLHYEFDQAALEQLGNELYGKRFLITDRKRVRPTSRSCLPIGSE